MHSVVDALPPPTSGHKSCFNIEKTMKLPGKSLWSKSTPNRSNYEQSLFLQRQAVI